MNPRLAGAAFAVQVLTGPIVGLARQARNVGAESDRIQTPCQVRLLGRQACADDSNRWQPLRLPLDQVVGEVLSARAEQSSTPPPKAVEDERQPTPPRFVDDQAPAALPEHEFRDLVEDASRHLNDAPALRQHRLLGLTPSTVGAHLHAAEATALLQGDLPIARASAPSTRWPRISPSAAPAMPGVRRAPKCFRKFECYRASVILSGAPQRMILRSR